MSRHGSDPLLMSVEAQLALLKAKKLSAHEVMQLTLERIAALNPSLNAVVYHQAEIALTEAKAADARYAKKTNRPLEGLPVTIKDALDVQGMPSTSGSLALKDRIPEQDAVAVARLRQAGAIIIGKTNVPVFCGDFQSFNPLHGITNHPWNSDYSSGGSSGGAAVAVATGMSSFELGTDQGSSIRWPAVTNGITGLKTSWGLISSWGSIPPPPEKRVERNVDLVTVGPMTRHASDLALLLPILSGPRNPAVAGQILPPARQSAAGRPMDITKLRVAVWLDEAIAPVDQTVVDGVLHAAKLLESAGATIDDKARPGFRFEECYEVFALLNHWLVGYALPARIRDKIASRASSFSTNDLSHAALQARGMLMTPGLYQQVHARQLRIQKQWAAFFQKYDVLLCPAAPVSALKHDHDPNIMARTLDVNGEKLPYLNFLHWAAPAAAGNLPAAVAPAGFVDAGPHKGMPRGVQIIGPFMEDNTPIAVAAFLQELQGGFQPPPILSSK
jgi:amidase